MSAADRSVTYSRDMGGTTDPFRIRVHVQRRAVLDDRLATIEQRTDGDVVLVVREKYDDQRRMVISRESVKALIYALDAALDDTTPADQEVERR